MAIPLRVLILEDRQDDAEIMTRHLRQAGFAPEAKRVETEADFRTQLESHPDIILADYKLPQFDGLQALRLLHDRSLDIPFILVSGAIGEDLAVSALREGATDYVVKDRMARLGPAVRQALDQKRLREEKRHADTMRRESEARYRSLFEGVPVGLYRATPTGQILDANTALIRMLGYPDRDALLSVNLAVVYVDPLVREQCMTVLERQGTLDAEVQLRRRDGAVLWVRDRARAVRDPFDRIVYCEGAIEDITDRKRTEVALQQSEQRFRALIENSSDAVALLGADGTVLYVSPSVRRVLGYDAKERLGRNRLDIVHPEDRDRVQQGLADLARMPGAIQGDVYRVRHKDGSWRWVESVDTNLLTESGVRGIVTNFRDITDRRRADEQIRHQVETLTALYGSSQQLAQSLDFHQLARDVVRTCADSFSARLAWLGRLDADGSLHVLAQFLPENDFPRDVVARWNQSTERPGVIRRALGAGTPILVHDMTQDPDPDSPQWQAAALRLGFRSVGAFPLISRTKNLGILALHGDRADFFTPERVEFLQTYAHHVAAALENARLFEEAERRATEVAALYENTHDLATQRDLPKLLEIIVGRAAELLRASGATLSRYDAGQGDLVLTVGKNAPVPVGSRVRLGEGGTGQVALTRHPLIVNPPRAGDRRPTQRATASPTASVGVPMLYGGELIGVLEVHEAGEGARTFTEDDARLLTLFAGQAASAIHNARLHDEADRRLRQLQALRDIDMAISSSLDLRLTLNVLLENVLAQLQVDAAAVLLYNPVVQILEYGAAQGFRTAALQHTHLRLGEGHAGRAALERRLISIPHLAQEPGDFSRAPLLLDEEFVAYSAVPLMAKGQVKGVLELFHRSPLTPGQEWQDFLQALAGQAAIAIDSAALFTDLQRSSADLAQAYDTTLEGWSRALDLRDRETEGHTQRVTEMTLRLARAVGVPEHDLVHIRRGALLHDIGKMGIPDSILFKPGPLSAEEWEVMRRHPVYAYELLSPILYLRPALDIPYCHHEKWDGTGYPRGLKQEEIPLPARIFAVADVWDALRSDRPYRPAWSDDRARDYIREQAGTHFDPRAVDLFFQAERDIH
jgi:PAS domain S-box-containing protein